MQRSRKRKRRKCSRNVVQVKKIKYSVIRKSRVGDNHTCCTVCRCDLSVSHGGIGDVEKHVRATKHIVKAGSSAGQLTSKICIIFGRDSAPDPAGNSRHSPSQMGEGHPLPRPRPSRQRHVLSAFGTSLSFHRMRSLFFIVKSWQLCSSL